MEQILSGLSTSISEFKRNPTAIIEQSQGETIAILNHNRPSAYLVSPQKYEFLMDLLDDAELIKLAKERLKDESKAIRVELDDL